MTDRTSLDPVLVTREPTPVSFVEGRDEGVSINASWRTLEDLFPSLRGHKFLATFDPTAGWYRACVARTSESDSITAGLPTGIVPGGRYARLRLRGDDGVPAEELFAAFAALEEAHDVDQNRPRIEHYRRHTEVDALVPVR